MRNYELKGVVFYNTAYQNMVFDVTESIETKQEALKSYTAQFSEADLEFLIQQTTFLAKFVARGEPFDYGEALKVLAPWMLHGVAVTVLIVKGKNQEIIMDTPNMSGFSP